MIILGLAESFKSMNRSCPTRLNPIRPWLFLTAYFSELARIKLFLYIVHSFRINCFYIKLNIHFIPNIECVFEFWTLCRNHKFAQSHPKVGFRFQCRIKKENYFVDKKFSISYWIFSSNYELFYILKFSLNTCNIILHSSKKESKV